MKKVILFSILSVLLYSASGNAATKGKVQEQKMKKGTLAARRRDVDVRTREQKDLDERREAASAPAKVVTVELTPEEGKRPDAAALLEMRLEDAKERARRSGQRVLKIPSAAEAAEVDDHEAYAERMARRTMREAIRCGELNKAKSSKERVEQEGHVRVHAAAIKEYLDKIKPDPAAEKREVKKPQDARAAEEAAKDRFEHMRAMLEDLGELGEEVESKAARKAGKAGKAGKSPTPPRAHGAEGEAADQDQAK